MSGSWGTSWGTSWGNAWAFRSAPPASESASTAGLRAYALLELPGLLGGPGIDLVITDLVGILSTMAELGEAATINGDSVDVIGSTPYQDAVLNGQDVAGRITRLYCAAAAFDATAAQLGSSVTFRSLVYSIGRIERLDAGLVRLELMR